MISGENRVGETTTPCGAAEMVNTEGIEPPTRWV